MPEYRTGNMWDCLEEVDHFLITTNAIVKQNGALVMGAGLAKQARDAYPGLDQTFGEAIEMWAENGVYGVILWANLKFGAFQVKHHFKDQANLHLITYSTGMLKVWAQTKGDQKFALNFPGIGNGGLPYDQVKPIVDLLPNNVQVWTYN